jgi:hypothetical protein
MSKKLDELLEAINQWNLSEAINKAYNAYLEERMTLPQQGDMIEVRSNVLWYNERFIGFNSYGKAITEDKHGKITIWDYYRIPTPKKKWKVVKGELFPFVLLESDITDFPTITTFED